MADIIRPLVESDAEALFALRIENRTFMTPYEPDREDTFFTLERQRDIGGQRAGLGLCDPRRWRTGRDHRPVEPRTWPVPQRFGRILGGSETQWSWPGVTG